MAMSETSTQALQAQFDRLLNARRHQVGGRAAATQRKLEAIGRELADRESTAASDS